MILLKSRTFPEKVTADLFILSVLVSNPWKVLAIKGFVRGGRK